MVLSLTKLILTKTFSGEEGIFRMKWPAKSPGLNPFEHVCDAFGRAIARHHYPPNTRQMLKWVLIEEWGLLLQDEINNLF
ncbi:hypothetical protein TNCV_1444081 [Trichonephila clavipes]|nr:hypothetical protein TNCV_1444081 [Trichonephila clavipes]